MAYKFPDFDDIPPVPGCPPGCLWGFYDKAGKKDEIGSLNLLTAEVVKEASKEIKTGRHVQLDWPLDALKYPNFRRRTLNHKVIVSPDEYSLDDEVAMNTQSSSQWDSLKHYAYQKGQVYYNGLKFEDAKTTTTNGIHNWCERGGIVGRGILLDMVSYYEKHQGAAPDAWTEFKIPVADLEACMKECAITPRQGDILLVRSGFVKRHNEAADAERQAGTQNSKLAIGVEPCEEMVRWLYKHHFAALVGDTLSFESSPRDLDNPWALHEYALVFWGTPLGELWDLEGLAQMCKEENKWSFFVTSAPLYVQGGVGSTPQAIAIF